MENCQQQTKTLHFDLTEDTFHKAFNSSQAVLTTLADLQDFLSLPSEDISELELERQKIIDSAMDIRSEVITSFDEHGNPSEEFYISLFEKRKDALVSQLQEFRDLILESVEDRETLSKIGLYHYDRAAMCESSLRKMKCSKDFSKVSGDQINRVLAKKGQLDPFSYIDALEALISKLIAAATLADLLSATGEVIDLIAGVKEVEAHAFEIRFTPSAHKVGHESAIAIPFIKFG